MNGDGKASDCEEYGSGHGCDEACPVWRRGECDNPDVLELAESDGWER
jgi:hypothetical protein